jgi:hypothetical protein
MRSHESLPGRAHEALPGRTPMAWMRACLARTRWIGRYARAAGWPSDFPSCDVTAWDASPFSQALAACLGESPVQQRPAAAQRVRRAVPPLPHHAAGTTAEPAEGRRTAGPASGAGRPSVAPVGGRARTRAPHELLARAAGQATSAIQPASAPRRVRPEPTRPAERRIPAPAPAAVAVASLGRRLAGRMAQRIGPEPVAGSADPAPAANGTKQRLVRGNATDSGLRGRAASSPIPTPPGWTHRIAAPTVGVVVREQPEDAAWPSPIRRTPTEAAEDAPRRAAWRRAVEGADPGRLAGQAAAVPAHHGPVAKSAGMADHGPASASAHHDPARDAELITRPEGGFEASRPSAADRAWRSGHATGQSHFAPNRHASLALDPVEFAEQLRAVLQDDARRHGIEV